MSQLLSDTTLVLSDGSKVKGGDFLKDKIVALYFSAMWCGPCRAFTPKLKKFYEDLKAAGKNFEVVFVSRDHDAKSLLEYYTDHHGQWTFLEFGSPEIQNFLEKYEVKTIPSLKVIKPDGTVVVNDARTEIQQNGSHAIALFQEWLSFYNV